MRKPIAILFKESFEFSLIASRLSARYSAGTSSMGNPDSALRLFRSVMSLTPFWVLAILGTISQKQAIRNLTGDMNRSSIEGITPPSRRSDGRNREASAQAFGTIYL
jgi:hypothetical protein